MSKKRWKLYKPTRKAGCRMTIDPTLQAAALPVIIIVFELLKTWGVTKDSKWYVPIVVLVGVISGLGYAAVYSPGWEWWMAAGVKDIIQTSANAGLQGALVGLAAAGIYRGAQKLVA